MRLQPDLIRPPGWKPDILAVRPRGKSVPTPGVEPGPPGWKPDILAVRPRGKSDIPPQSPLKRKQDLECKTPKKIKTSNENGKGTDDESSPESDKEDVFLKTPSKPMTNSTSNASKAPKTPKEKLVLPEGFTFIVSYLVEQLPHCDLLRLSLLTGDLSARQVVKKLL